MPDSEEFFKFVELYEKIYKNLDRIYLKALRDFENVKLSSFSDDNIESILRPYLLKWGRMGRVLGLKGCKSIGDELVKMDSRLVKWRQKDLSKMSLDNHPEEIEAIYDKIVNAKWESEKGKTKRVGPTSASKILHLVAPNLFMIWDREIRKCYGFQDTGEEYVRFLANMKNWLEKLRPTIEKLQNKHHKSCMKIIDEYNWIKCRPDLSSNLV